MTIEAMKQALRALEHSHATEPIWKTPIKDAITALRTAIEQAETAREPVAWATMLGSYAHVSWGKDRPDYPIRYEVPLYTTPPAQEFVCSTGLCHYKAQREWVGLTDEEVHEAFCHVEYETPNDWNTDPDDWCQQFARYIDARLKEKNT